MSPNTALAHALVNPVVTSRRDNGRKRPRGYASWRPQAKARVLLEQVEQVLDDYRDYLPLTVRQIFYRLVGAFDYAKTENAYNNLADKLVRARRARMIPFEVIRDDGPVTYTSPWHSGTDDFWDDVGGLIRNYRRDRQVGQGVRVELWSEAAGMAPQLATVADRYSVPVFSAGGFASLTATRLIASRALARTVPTVLLHVGDFDPSGASIFDAMATDAAAFVTADRVIQNLEIRPVRVALTADQVAAYDLPTSPAKATDSRTAAWDGETCQLEALPPDELAAIVDAAIAEQLDLDRFEAQVALEEPDRLELWKGLPA